METSIDLYADDYAADYDDKNESDEPEIIEEPEVIEDEPEVIENEQIDTENDNGENKDEEKKKVKPKRVIRNPRPKLNVETLKSRKGLMCLEGYFKNKKFKGSGHEEEDLKTIMKTYEYWCHRLFPKFSFDDCVTHLEKLGTKKNVQVFIKRIRMDMVFEEENVIRSDNEEDILQITNNHQFDNLLTQPNINDASSTLSEEQMERIRINKERANRLRQERLQKQKEQEASTHQEDYTEDIYSERISSQSNIHPSTVEDDSQEHATDAVISTVEDNSQEYATDVGMPTVEDDSQEYATDVMSTVKDASQEHAKDILISAVEDDLQEPATDVISTVEDHPQEHAADIVISTVENDL